MLQSLQWGTVFPAIYLNLHGSILQNLAKLGGGFSVKKSLLQAKKMTKLPRKSALKVLLTKILSQDPLIQVMGKFCNILPHRED